jgi:hypothetical protein
MKVRDPIADAFYTHKLGAKKRGIKFEFTRKEWVAWWEAQLGPDWRTKRGHKTGQFVMARNGDSGPYAAWNVRCTTVEDNHREHNANKVYTTKHARPLAPNTVVAIFKAKGRYADIAQRFGVTVHRVHCVKTRKYYRNITDKL